MEFQLLKQILSDIKENRITIEEGIEKLKDLPFKELEIACVDHHRTVRKGFPEVIFGEGKESEEIISIIEEMKRKKENILVTRVSEKKARKIKDIYPEATYHRRARVLTLINTPVKSSGKGTILVVCAGTSDLPVAEEAFITAKFLGNPVEKIYDVGIAGIHRLFAYMDKLRRASVIIAVAGMEGALPSVIAGLVESPVIAVPTSVGYGASFSGISALLAMLNSCAPGIAVVNIDNGLGAAYISTLINRR
ncbi:MAG: nickel pincer cofactor biosynthesis protein LarB [Deltaproteobacteria bacterium]|nr:MAG: nickel pincer cofactor biosynthesis protein LarB [Deltaproteobacteria bacterium]